MSEEVSEPRESSLKLAGDYITARDAVLSAREQFSETLNTILHKALLPKGTAEEIGQAQQMLSQEIREMADWYIAVSAQWIEATRKLYQADLTKFEEFQKLRNLNLTLFPAALAALPACLLC